MQSIHANFSLSFPFLNLSPDSSLDQSHFPASSRDVSGFHMQGVGSLERELDRLTSLAIIKFLGQYNLRIGRISPLSETVLA